MFDNCFICISEAVSAISLVQYQFCNWYCPQHQLWTAIHIHHFCALLPHTELLLLPSSWSCMVISRSSSCLKSWHICPLLKRSDCSSMTIQVSSRWVNKAFISASGGNVLTPCLQPFSVDKELAFHSHLFYIGTTPLGLQVLFLIAIWEENQILNSLVLLVLKLNVSWMSDLHLQNALNDFVQSCFKLKSRNIIV